jgi:hypothetical protein
MRTNEMATQLMTPVSDDIPTPSELKTHNHLIGDKAALENEGRQNADVGGQ